MCILCGDNVDLLACGFYFYEREFKYCFQVFFIDGMCVVALALVTNTMSRATFHPLVIMFLMSGWYFVVFLSRVSAINLSLQYVNPMKGMVIFVVGVSGRGWLYGCPMTHSMFGLNMALQWHLWVPHVHGNSYVGTVFS